MPVEVHFNTTVLEEAIRLLVEDARNNSIPQVAKIYGRELPKLYAAGIGGDGVAFHDYNTNYAKRMGISAAPKTLKRTDGRLYEMELQGDILTVKDSTIGKTNSRTVALGQQTGASGRWPYSNVMFGVNESLQETAALELATFLSERIRV